MFSSTVPAADETVDDLEDLEEKHPTIFKGHREHGGDVIAKMQSVLETRFGTTLLSTTDDDRESDRLATIGVSTTLLIKFSIFNQILNHFMLSIIICLFSAGSVATQIGHHCKEKSFRLDQRSD